MEAERTAGAQSCLVLLPESTAYATTPSSRGPAHTPWSLEATSKDANKPEPGWTTTNRRDEVPARSRQSAEIVYKFTLFFLDTPFTGKVARTKFENKKIFQKEGLVPEGTVK